MKNPKKRKNIEPEVEEIDINDAAINEKAEKLANLLK